MSTIADLTPKSAIGGIMFYRDGEHTSTLHDPLIGEIAKEHGKSRRR
jgi:hypothetical protein